MKFYKSKKILLSFAILGAFTSVGAIQERSYAMGDGELPTVNEDTAILPDERSEENNKDNEQPRRKLRNDYDYDYDFDVYEYTYNDDYYYDNYNYSGKKGSTLPPPPPPPPPPPVQADDCLPVVVTCCTPGFRSDSSYGYGSKKGYTSQFTTDYYYSGKKGSTRLYPVPTQVADCLPVVTCGTPPPRHIGPTYGYGGKKGGYTSSSTTEDYEYVYPVRQEGCCMRMVTGIPATTFYGKKGGYNPEIQQSTYGYLSYPSAYPSMTAYYAGGKKGGRWASAPQPANCYMPIVSGCTALSQIGYGYGYGYPGFYGYGYPGFYGYGYPSLYGYGYGYGYGGKKGGSYAAYGPSRPAVVDDYAYPTIPTSYGYFGKKGYNANAVVNQQAAFGPFSKKYGKRRGRHV